MHFAFFDFDEPMAFFFADYIAVMILFVWAGYLIGSSSKEKKN
jgi:peptidoglycan/LPS O-acetylase OafA/YrhL